MTNSKLVKLRDAVSGKPDGRNPTLLIVGPVEDDGRSIFDQFSWPVERVQNCLETFRRARLGLPRVVVCERDLPDGDWKSVLEIAASLHRPPNVIVTSRLADDFLWAEVLNLGGYDVLAKPLDKREVHRSITLAWDRWEHGEPAHQARAVSSDRGGSKICLTA